MNPVRHLRALSATVAMMPWRQRIDGDGLIAQPSELDRPTVESLAAGHELREARLQLGLEQTDLARALQVRVREISLLESGVWHGPRANVLRDRLRLLYRRMLRSAQNSTVSAQRQLTEDEVPTGDGR